MLKVSACFLLPPSQYQGQVEILSIPPAARKTQKKKEVTGTDLWAGTVAAVCTRTKPYTRKPTVRPLTLYQYLSLWACVYYLCCILFLPNNQQPTLDPHPPPPRSHSQVTHPSWLSVKPGRGSPLLRHQLGAVTHGGGPASEIETVRTELLIDQSSPAMAEH